MTPPGDPLADRESSGWSPACAGQVAVVTGAARGIGQAIAVRVAAEGARVLAVARTAHPGESTYAGSLDETLALVREAGGDGAGLAADLADPTARSRIAAAAENTFATPATILVNNAAAPRAFELRFSEMTTEAFHLAVEVNLWAAWELSVMLIPGMRRAGAGWILNISSHQAAPRVGPPFPPHQHGGACLYGGTKAMLDRLTTGAAMDLVEDNIAVNSLAPKGAVATPHSEAVARLSPARTEPVEALVSAAIALVSGPPTVLTGRVCSSLSLIKELSLPVRTLDGQSLVPGWQPEDIAPERLVTSYLAQAASPTSLRGGADHA